MTRTQAIRYRFQGLVVALTLAGAGVLIAVGYEVRSGHHRQTNGTSVWLGLIAGLMIIVAGIALFSKPDPKDRSGPEDG